MEPISDTAALCRSQAASARLRVFQLLTVVAVAIAVSSQLLPFLTPSSCPGYSGSSPLRFSLQKQPLRRPARAQCAMFNFGDSNTDTGGFVASSGLRLQRPVGRRFFGKPSGRFCDGRLYVDFICDRLGLDHLSPYLESSGVTFRHGVNFAVAGATAAAQSKSYFSLLTQVRQFRHFKARTAELLPLGLGSRITDEEFRNAVYSFDIGQNDISLAFGANLTYERILQEAIPAIITRIRDAVTMVYEAGGRKFLMYNTGPSGCQPRTLARRRRRDGELDHAGCLVRHNDADKAFNARLSRLCHQLTAELANATVVCVDMYAIKYGLLVNHMAHGFSNPLMACCGSGGPPYNYEANKKKASGKAKVKACSELDASKYISWDGTHYTEAANKIVADKVLSSEYNEPQLHLQTLCST